MSEKNESFSLPALTIVVGHYGVGKTNLALNLVLLQRKTLQGGKTSQALVDLDIVNPYFRSGDFARGLQTLGISLLGPVHGASNLDTPSLMPGIDVAITEASPKHPVIIDVGGDADGARALARYASMIENQPDRMVLYVVNSARPEVSTPQAALQIMREIEETSGVSITHIAGNTHLKEQTTAETVIASLPYVLNLAVDAELPVAFVAAPRSYAAEVQDAAAAGLRTTTPVDIQAVEATNAQPAPTLCILPIDILVGCSWEALSPLVS
ncbi:MAG: ParA family protein [Coriobacteriia bacterium]|nr:ParA family protein [Coriobacteriia bacterium]